MLIVCLSLLNQLERNSHIIALANLFLVAAKAIHGDNNSYSKLISTIRHMQKNYAIVRVCRRK
jgi:hypothetical protein